jgi:uncharacterized protein (TIGR03083 family)
VTVATVLDHAGEYRQLRTRVVDLVRGCDAEALVAVSPATPEWRVRDVLAHLSGVCVDIAAGNLDGVATDPWTAAQVDARRDWPIGQLLDEWEGEGEKIEAVIRGAPDMPGWNTFLFDAATHEQDVRGALGVPGMRDQEPIVSLVGNMVDGIAQKLRDDGAGSIRFDFGDDLLVAGDGDPASTLSTTRFEMFRAVTGRRSVAQLRGYDWDPEPRVDYLLISPIFHARATDLVE